MSVEIRSQLTSITSNFEFFNLDSYGGVRVIGKLKNAFYFHCVICKRNAFLSEYPSTKPILMKRDL